MSHEQKVTGSMVFYDSWANIRHRISADDGKWVGVTLTFTTHVYLPDELAVQLDALARVLAATTRQGTCWNWVIPHP